MVKLFLDSFWPMVLAGIKYSIPMMLETVINSV